jgi:hypothetical protein
MKITTKNVMQVETAINEQVCLDTASETLQEVLTHLETTCGNFGEGLILYNPDTGEIVEDEEIMRARAILQFFLGNPLLEIRFQFSH